MLKYQIYIDGKVASEPLTLEYAMKLYKMYFDEKYTTIEIRRITD